MTRAAKLLTSVTVFGLLALPVAFANCGGGSGGDRGGTGGGSGSGGTTGSGGRSGSGGAVGSGGSTGSGGSMVTFSCMPGVSPTNPLLSDFSATTWSNTAGKWGMAANLVGSLFSFHGPGVATAWNSSMVANEALVLSGTVDAGDYANGGMSPFDQCVNTSAYTGVQFTLGGTTAGCDLYFQVQTFSQQSTTNHGGCVTPPGPCYAFPKVKVTFGTTPITVRFSELLNGAGTPVGASAVAMEMVGLQWQLQSPPPGDAGLLQAACTGVNLTIDDVKFVN